ncbi:MAG TPA: hypothetical protein V6C82_06785 [Chroococcales cyanobacterium]|jgi:hypothetical protein
MKLRTCLVVAEGASCPFHVLEELENGVLVALRPADTARIFGGGLSLPERLRLIEDCLVGICPKENRFLSFPELKKELASSKTLFLRLFA